MPPSPRSLSPISLSPISGLHPYQPLALELDDTPASPNQKHKHLHHHRRSAPPDLDPAFLLRTPPSPALSSSSLKGSRRRKRHTMGADLAAVADLTNKLMAVADSPTSKPRGLRSPAPRSPPPRSPPVSPHPHVNEGELAPFRPGSRAPSRAASVASSSPAVTRPRSRPPSIAGPLTTPGTPSRPPSRAASRAGSRTGSMGKAGLKRHSRTRSLAEEIADAESKLPFYDSDDPEEKNRDNSRQQYWVEAMRDGPTSPSPSKVPVARRSSVGSAAGSAASGSSRAPTRAHVRRDSVEYGGGRVSRESARHSSGSQSPAPPGSPSSRIPTRIPSLKRNDTVQSIQSMQSFKSAKGSPMHAPTPTHMPSPPSRRLSTPASPKPMAKKIGPPAPLKPTPPPTAAATTTPTIKSPAPAAAAKKNPKPKKEPSKEEKVRTPSASMSRSVIKALKPKGSLRKAALSPGGSPEPTPEKTGRQRSNSSSGTPASSGSKGSGAFATLVAASNAAMLVPSSTTSPKKVSPVSSIASLKSFASSLSHRSSKGERSSLVDSLSSEEKGNAARAPSSPTMEQKEALAPPQAHLAPPEPDHEGDHDTSSPEGSLTRSKSGRNMFSRLRTLSFTPKPATITPKATKGGSRPPSVVDVFAPSGEKKSASTSSRHEEAIGENVEPVVVIQVEPPVVFEPVQDATDTDNADDAPEPDATDFADPTTTPAIILSPPRSPASEVSSAESEFGDSDGDLLLDSDDELRTRPGEGLLSDASLDADADENDQSQSGSESPGLTWSTGDSLEIVKSDGSLGSLSSSGSDNISGEDVKLAEDDEVKVDLDQPLATDAQAPNPDTAPEVQFPVPVPFVPAIAVDAIPEDPEPDVLFPVPVPFSAKDHKSRPPTPVVPPLPSRDIEPGQFSAEPEAPASEGVWWAATQRPPTASQVGEPVGSEPVTEPQPTDPVEEEEVCKVDDEEHSRRVRSAAPSPEPSPEHYATPLPNGRPNHALEVKQEVSEPAKEPIHPALSSVTQPVPTSEPEDPAVDLYTAPLPPRQQLPPGQFVALSPCLVSAFGGTSFSHNRAAPLAGGSIAALIGLPGLGYAVPHPLGLLLSACDRCRGGNELLGSSEWCGCAQPRLGRDLAPRVVAGYHVPLHPGLQQGLATASSLLTGEYDDQEDVEEMDVDDEEEGDDDDDDDVEEE
ncbi:uncharacterized protein LOC62_02G002991 [Vanrija pseudolonga]|uniref:Uncharacterized protein n=1 Tax=Vanrija pseudolonga TaxID=143232 RepID=A0AAF1BKC8_9TREE|nr:hypothetical protein LOC62_02G002991 [Vanrija pseudolonga]